MAASSAAIAGTSERLSLATLIQLYKQLSKHRLSALVVSTAAAGYIAGSGEKVDWGGLAWTCAGTFGCAAAANTLNQVYEVATDSLMERTKRRPLPLGLLSRRHALVFAGVMGIGAICILGCKANATTAVLGAANIGLYAAIYTPLKVVSVANTWVGAVVGAIPPLMGWAAAAGQLDIGAGVLAGALYFWQLPHFLSLAWLCRADYARGGYKMLSLFDATGRRTAACALRNCLYLMPLGAAATYLCVTTPAFAYESAILTGIMATTAASFLQTPSPMAARRLFRASLLHLPLFMVGMALHRIPQTEERRNSQHVMLRLGSSSQHALAGGAPAEAAISRGPMLGAISVAPFPFLPVPLQLRCPSKVACAEGPVIDRVEETRSS
ncbi:g217 [Coccomyxa elongata]